MMQKAFLSSISDQSGHTTWMYYISISMRFDSQVVAKGWNVHKQLYNIMRMVSTILWMRATSSSGFIMQSHQGHSELRHQEPLQPREHLLVKRWWWSRKQLGQWIRWGREDTRRNTWYDRYLRSLNLPDRSLHDGILGQRFGKTSML